MSSEHEDLVRLRGHMLLCLQGFRGKGYDAAFVENMSALSARLLKHPETSVCLTDFPDALCQACPHLSGGCTLKGPDFEEHMAAQDQDVLKRLGFQVAQEITWRQLLHRIGERIRGDMLKDICGECPWLPLGYCQEGVERLSSSTGSKTLE